MAATFVAIVARRPAHDFELLVALRARLAAFELLREEEVHALAAEAGRRVEGRGLAPAATGQARLFRELAACAVERRLARLERARRKLEQLLPHRFAPLTHERQHPLAVDGDDRDGAWMIDDLTFVIAPALDDDIDQLPVVDGLRAIRLHAARRSTSCRCSASNHGGEPAAALARA